MNNLIKKIVESKFNFNIDIEDNEKQDSLSKSKYNSMSLKALYELSQYVVDLGLPSGTLWCRYNLGCNFDLLNNNPELTKPEDWYGNYYAWGETNTKFDDSKYELLMSKYNIKNNLILLLPEDDAAYLNMHIGNYKFHIPTKELYEELIKYTTGYWKKNYKNIQGLCGWIIEGKNYSELFLPAAGYYSNRHNKLFNVGYFGDYFTSTMYFEDKGYYLHNNTDAYHIVCGGITSDGDSIQLNHHARYNSLSIRPIINLK